MTSTLDVDLVAGKMYRHALSLIDRVRKVKYIIPSEWIEAGDWSLDEFTAGVNTEIVLHKTANEEIVLRVTLKGHTEKGPVTKMRLHIRVQKYIDDELVDDEVEVFIYLSRTGPFWTASASNEFRYKISPPIWKAVIKVADMLNQNPVPYDARKSKDHKSNARKFKDLPPNVHRFIASKMSLRNATRLSAVNKTTRSAIADDVAARAAQRIKAVQRARGASADLLASKIRSKVIQLVNKLRQVNYIIPMDWALDRANDGRMRWVLGSEAVGRITVTETKTHTDTKRHILEVYLTGRFVPENNERQEDFDVGIRQYVSSIGGTTYRGTMFLRLKRNTDTNLFRVTARLTAHRVYESQVGQSVKKAATALNDVIPYEMQPR